MLQNAYFLAKIGADTVENKRNFAEKFPKIGNYPTKRLVPAGLRADDHHQHGLLLEHPRRAASHDDGAHLCPLLAVLRQADSIVASRFC